RQATGGEKRVLPGAAALVLDEAQHLEDVATEALGATISPARWQRLARQLQSLTLRHPTVAASELGGGQERGPQWLQPADPGQRGLVELLERLRPAAERAAPAGPTRRLGDERAAAGPLLEALGALVEDLGAGAPHWLSEEQREGWERLTAQVDE